MMTRTKNRMSGFLAAVGLFLSGPFGQGLAQAEPMHLKINCGDGTPDVPGWEDEDAYRTDGDPYDFTGEVDLNDQIDPAPADLYLTCIHRAHSYLFSVPDGRYLVRLHFFDGPVGDGRAMDYTIEGQLLLDDFSIVTAAGGGLKALVREFEIDVQDGDGLSIVADPDQGNDSFETGIEIIWLDYPPCPDDLSRCGEDCVDTNTNPDHCGGCDKPCTGSDLCIQGACRPDCSLSDMTLCGDDCVDTNINPNHCGGCDTTCARGDLCIQGSCHPDCGAGTMEVDGGCVPASTQGSGCASTSDPPHNWWWLFMMMVFLTRRPSRHLKERPNGRASFLRAFDTRQNTG